MRVARIKIENFRGISSADILLSAHSVLIGDNNTGKTTVLEALDLALGPDRLNRFPPIDEHDFFCGQYTAAPVSASNDGAVTTATEGESAEAEPAVEEAERADEARGNAPQITIEATVIELSDEQRRRFKDHLEFWDTETCTLYDTPSPEGVDADQIVEALRVSFVGKYVEEEDDFEGRTYFSRSLEESDRPDLFTKRDKQLCGFLYLRNIRTGSRALTLERGSLLDVILRLKEIRPRMWEDTIEALSSHAVASDPSIGLSDVLSSVDEALKKYVPREWGAAPRLKVSNLTREHLRKVITAFVSTGSGEHAAPFYRQGAGTINMLVLALLSLIAEGKNEVVFAMEEPETAIPPYAQKRIVHEIRKLSSQAIFTSHSPYVLEEFELDETVVLNRSEDCTLTHSSPVLPTNLKLKRYRQDFRTRFCEGLLARRILVAEGSTETDAFPVVCRRLSELDPARYSSLEALGVAVVNAGGEDNIPGLAKMYAALDKRVFALCDHQDSTKEALIESEVEKLFMHPEHSFEALVIQGTTTEALERFADMIDWPPHLAAKHPDPKDDPQKAVGEYFAWSKGNWGAAEFLAQCDEAEVPEWLRSTALSLLELCAPTPEEPEGDAGDDKLESSEAKTAEGGDETV
ncbi:AAA family ATPase [Henriciella sp.]|uniref:ATP-dependent nuclease n=1 Tax=Henriciella sp. TaxID=1968823 RepID=UPI00263877FD|nr:AAA family ATPase [Henriciella sp.]